MTTEPGHDGLRLTKGTRAMKDEVTMPNQTVDPRLTAVEWCRKCRDLDLPQAPAEFIVWGKLFPPDALGPRCRAHLDASIPVDRIDQYAVFDLRKVARLGQEGDRWVSPIR